MKVEIITTTDTYDQERRVNDFIGKVGSTNIVQPIQHEVTAVEVEDDKQVLHYTSIITYRD